jgi:hypothetical protein
MKKDVIYIDIEDDITAIIGKVKTSKDKIVALVPPKRIGVLQSAVNLRLLARAAKDSGKHLVIITNNKALSMLSATAAIPIAKTLQSKPEIAEIAALEVDDGDDIIDGAQLPVGELAKMAPSADSDSSAGDEVAEAVDEIDIDQDSSRFAINPSLASSKSKSVQSAKNKIKVPDFSRFRKKLFIGTLAGIASICFLVWAIRFAPAATVIITAKTSPAPVSMTVKLGGTTATDVSKNVIQTVTKQIKKDVSVEFTATGQKDAGDKATGKVTIENCDSNHSITISANTVFTSSSGKRFVNTNQVTVPGMEGSASTCRRTREGAGTAEVTVTAEQAGSSYNIGPDSYSIAGIDGDVYANGDQMTGGTTKMVSVVTADDVQKASQTLVDLSSDSVKRQLIEQFTNGEKVIADSFDTNHAPAVSTPTIGSEVTGKAKLTSLTTYSMTAIAKSELQEYLKSALNKQIDDNQRIYNDGSDKVVLSGYLSNDQGATVNISTTGQIGPSINKNSIKEQVKGMQYGDAQALISRIEGVSSVDIKFSYFWVKTIPEDTSKIGVEFILEND